MRVVAGESFNHLSRCLVTPVMTPTAHSLSIISDLWDGRAGTAVRFGSVAADSTVTADLNQIENGDFENNPPDIWIQTVGTLTRDTGTVHAGAASGKLAGTGVGAFYQDFTARSGEIAGLEWALYGGSSSTAALSLLNLDTGRYLQTDGVWGGALQIDSQTTAAWKTGNRIFSVEGPSETLKDLTTLRLLCTKSATANCFFDDIFYYPATDLCAVFGHSIVKLLTPEFRADVSGSTLLATMIPRRRAFYGLLSSPVAQRYVRLKLAGLSIDAPEMAELVFAQTIKLPRAPRFPLRSDGRFRQIRNETPAGEQWRMRLGDDEVRELNPSFTWTSEEEYRELRDVLFRASGGGISPAILIPDVGDDLPGWGDESGDIYFGRMDDVLNVNSETRTGGGELVRTTEFRFQESPSPRT